MPKICNINPDGTLGSKIDDGVCWGFLGRLDDYDEFQSNVSQYVQGGGDTRVAAVAGVPGEFDNEALPYLTWLIEKSPYRDAFFCTAYEAVQQGYATVDLTAPNDTLILALSHLRRSQPWTHRIWGALPQDIPDGLKYLVCTVVNPAKYGYSSNLGSGEGDNTSTVMDGFTPSAWHAWLTNEKFNGEEPYNELGGYYVGFCTDYCEQFSSPQGGETLGDKLYNRLREFGKKVQKVRGLFFEEEIVVSEVDPLPALEAIVNELEGTEFCVKKYLTKEEVQ